LTEDALKPEVIKWAAFYEHRCKMGAKQIFHLEAFVAKYMRLYERYVLHFQRTAHETNNHRSYAMGIDFDST
jgi:hypothetical protein